MEVLKYRFNRSRTSNLFFFRDARGNEIDLIYTAGDHLALIEVKSSQTVNPDFFRGFGKFQQTVHPSVANAVVYGGTRNEKRSNGRIVSFRNIGNMLEEMDATM
jgi:hypothetical protein